jgi:1,4-alpha-glucan branching enzyme
MARTTTTTKSKAAGAARKKAAPSTEFAVYAPEAQEVQLVGDFNEWNGVDFKMRRFKDGTWKKKVKLKPGRYEYRFVVDGSWWTDPENPFRQQNAFGSDNSVVDISE